MKTVWIALLCVLAPPVWADEPQFRCETMLFVYNDAKMHSMIKSRMALEVANTWRAVTGHDIQTLDDMFVYLNCLSTPESTVHDAVRRAFQNQRLELYTER